MSAAALKPRASAASTTSAHPASKARSAPKPTATVPPATMPGPRMPLSAAAQGAIAEWAQNTPSGRRFTTRLRKGVGLLFVAQYYLGLATPECHERWYRQLDEHDRALALAPRSHGKTSSISRVLVLREILANRNIRILLLSRTTESAKDSLSVLKTDLETNEKILADWQVDGEGGSLRSKGSWGQTQFTVRRTKNLRDPTVRARGWGSKVTGGRYDLIILDDIEDDETVMNSQQRKKTLNRLRTTVAPLLDTGGRIVVIGTKKHADDLYTHVANDPTYAVIHDRALLEWPDLSKVTYETALDESGKEIVKSVHLAPGAGGRALWPEKWSIEALLLIWRSIGSRAFNQEYQNEATDDATTAFKLAWLDAAKKRGRGLGFVREGCIDGDPERPVPRCEGLIIWQSVDFALVDSPEAAEEQDSDWTVVCTWGLEWRTQTRYLLRLARRRGLSQKQAIGFVREEAARFPQRIAVVVERNAFGRLYESGLRRTTDLPIYAHTTDKKKHDIYEGVPAMSALYENEKIVLPYALPNELPANEDDPRGLVDEFVKEHHGLGREAHDDIVMASWISDVWIRRWIAVESRRRANGGHGGGSITVRTTTPQGRNQVSNQAGSKTSHARRAVSRAA